MDIYNKQQLEKRAAQNNSSDNGSNNSMPEVNNSGGSNDSNLAYLDSRDSAIRNISGHAGSNPNIGSNSGGSSGNNGTTI